MSSEISINHNQGSTSTPLQPNLEIIEPDILAATEEITEGIDALDLLCTHVENEKVKELDAKVKR